MSDTKTKTQKIIKVGNSYAVTLDKKFVDKVGLEVNDTVSMSYHTNPSRVVVSTLNKKSASLKDKRLSKAEKEQALASRITPELQEWVKDFIEENQEALDELAVS